MLNFAEETFVNKVNFCELLWLIAKISSAKFLLNWFISQNHLRYKIYAKATFYAEICLVFTKICMNKLLLLKLPNKTFLAESLISWKLKSESLPNYQHKKNNFHENPWSSYWEKQIKGGQIDPNRGIQNKYQQVPNRPW